MTVTLAPDALTKLLERTPAAYADLADMLDGKTGAGASERVSGGGGDDRPMPLAADVADHRAQLVHDLRFWCSHAPRLVGRIGDSVTRMCAVLIHAVPDMDTDDQADLLDTLRDWHAGARHRNDLPKLRGSIPLPANTCPNQSELDGTQAWACGGALRVLLPADKGQQPWLQCQSCGARYAAADLPAAANVRLPLSALASLTGVPVRTLQHRVQHGQMEINGGMARLGDVLAAEWATGAAQ